MEEEGFMTMDIDNYKDYEIAENQLQKDYEELLHDYKALLKHELSYYCRCKYGDAYCDNCQTVKLGIQCPFPDKKEFSKY
jgi:hypothetical protein